jgi:hypothetical protein
MFFMKRISTLLLAAIMATCFLTTAFAATKPVMPNSDDYATDEEFWAAYDKYYDDLYEYFKEQALAVPQMGGSIDNGDRYVELYDFQAPFIVAEGTMHIEEMYFNVGEVRHFNGVTGQIWKYEVDSIGMVVGNSLVGEFETGLYTDDAGGNFVGISGVDIDLAPGAYAFTLAPRANLGGIAINKTYGFAYYGTGANLGYISLDYIVYLGALDIGARAGVTLAQMKADMDFVNSVVAQKRADAAKAALAAKPITLKIDGRVIATDVPPIIENGRTLVPARAIVEELGYTVIYSATYKTIDVYSVTADNWAISMTVDSTIAYVRTPIYGVMTDVILDVPPKIVNGRTLVPARFIAETLGCSISWDAATKTVNITPPRG